MHLSGARYIQVVKAREAHFDCRPLQIPGGSLPLANPLNEARTISTKHFDNSYACLPDHFFARGKPDSVPAPTLLAWNAALADELGLSDLAGSDTERAAMFSGNALPGGAEPIALAYAGHQFGNFVPQLGDGRAVLLGEVLRPGDGRRFDVQLKGSGPTPFSRNGDGKSSLGPVIREYVLSEAMHRLQVPTTRALAAVQTGEQVFRESRLPGGVLTRIASSHIRIGTFEYFAARADREALQVLADYAIDRHYPDVKSESQPYLALFGRVLQAQAALVAHWMDIGFIHGVMNTDNTSISGETLDYGPCAFMDEFDINKVFSSIDRNGRYAYGQQAAIAQWNLARLAECLLRLDDDQKGFEAELGGFQTIFEDAYLTRMRAKLGLHTEQDEDGALINAWLQHLYDHELDYTLSFRQLAARLAPGQDSGAASPGSGADLGGGAFAEFEARWRGRLAEQPQTEQEVRQGMDASNPLFIPRNHQVERAIQAAIDGDISVFAELNQVLSQPFVEQPGFEAYAEPPLSGERVTRTFCGT